MSKHICPNCGHDIDEVGCYAVCSVGYSVSGDELWPVYCDGSDNEFRCSYCCAAFDPEEIGLSVN